MEIWRCKSNLLVLEGVKAEIDILPGREGYNLLDDGSRLKELIAYNANMCENLMLRAEFQEKRLQTQIAVVCAPPFRSLHSVYLY
jgi:hypothetical protein